jgi:uncharacterized membrane protein
MRTPINATLGTRLILLGVALILLAGALHSAALPAALNIPPSVDESLFALSLLLTLLGFTAMVLGVTRRTQAQIAHTSQDHCVAHVSQ